MPLSRIRWAPFRIAFRDPFHTAADADTRVTAPRYREGILLEIRDGDGIVGYGEASPLPERGEGTTRDVAELLGSMPTGLPQLDATTLLKTCETCIAKPGGRALACAMETALLDLRGRSEAMPIAALLAESGTTTPIVPVNATIGDPDIASAASAAPPNPKPQTLTPKP